MENTESSSKNTNTLTNQINHNWFNKNLLTSKIKIVTTINNKTNKQQQWIANGAAEGGGTKTRSHLEHFGTIFIQTAQNTIKQNKQILHNIITENANVIVGRVVKKCNMWFVDQLAQTSLWRARSKRCIPLDLREPSSAVEVIPIAEGLPWNG